MVNIRAEVSDDMTLRSVDFLVDGAAPLAIDPTAGQSAGTAEARLRLQSGDLYLDLQDADMLLLDAQRHLRKLSISGSLQPALGNDLAAARPGAGRERPTAPGLCRTPAPGGRPLLCLGRL